MSETNISMTGLNNRAELGHGLRRWFRPVRKCGRGIIVDRQNLAAEFRKPTRNKSRTSTVRTIDRNLEATRSNGGSVKDIPQLFDMVFDWVPVLDGGLDLVPSGLGKLSLMENV